MNDPEPQDAQRYPLDYEALNKGDSISPARLQDILGLRSTHPRYQLRLCALRSEVERGLEAIGRRWTVAIRKGFLVVLTDPEAAVYNTRQFENRTRQMNRAHQRNLAVDAGNLTQFEQVQHDRALVVQGVQIAALHAARRQLRAQPYERPNPGLPAAEG
jgi:hypothetical protein